ncbi:hypothetical protein N7522_005250 [Penicillium canescens]|nr:hypothetical protein N7522_005250 [Penicillium canescens]
MKIACHVTQIAKSVLQADNPQDIDAYEYELATSPCLSSLLARVTRYNFYKKADYNGDAVIELANGLVPNLTNEHLFFESPGLSRLNSITASRPPWRGFFRNRSNCDGSSFKGHLRELSLNLPVAKTGFFGTWKDQNAFAELLGLHLWRQSRPDESTSSMLFKRGKSLRKPSLISEGRIINMKILVTTDWLVRTRAASPNIQELRFTMFMTIGEGEKAVYNAVGGFPYLRDLKILMTCIGRPEERVSKDSKLHSRYYGNIEVNASLAETLSKQSSSLQRLDVDFHAMYRRWVDNYQSVKRRCRCIRMEDVGVSVREIGEAK